LFAQIMSSTCEFMFGNSTNKNIVHGRWQITPQLPYEWNLPNSGNLEKCKSLKSSNFIILVYRLRRRRMFSSFECGRNRILRH
jgi:hypothetical protein